MLAGPLSPHLCAECGFPQRVTVVDNYFSVFDSVSKFDPDLAAVQKRFYELSRALHPDRFAKLGGQAMQASLERMSFLNDAYRTLGSKQTLRAYLLKLEGVAVPSDRAVRPPLELAEAWFDLQDSVMENPESAAERLDEFGSRLSVLECETHEGLASLEREYNNSGERAYLERLALEIHSQSYLTSMARDLERLRGRLGVKKVS